MAYSAFLVIDGELQDQLSDMPAAQPGELVYMGHANRLWYRGHKRQPTPATEIGQPDGTSLTIAPKDWQYAGRPGFVRYCGTKPPPAEIKKPTWVKIAGQESKLVRARERLKPGQFTVFDKVLYFNPPEGQRPAEMAIEAVVRGNGVYMGGSTSHVVIRNFNVRHVFNDGYNIHGGCKDIAFYNCNAQDCGDEGFSAHSDCETLLDGAVFQRCDNGINNVNRAVSVTRNVIIADCRNQGFEGQEQSRATVENLILIDNRNQLSCPNIAGRNILIVNAKRGSQYTINAAGTLDRLTLVGTHADYRMVGLRPGAKLELTNSRFERAGVVHIRDDEPANLTIRDSLFHPETVVEWGAAQPFKRLKLAGAAKDATLPFAGAVIIDKPLLEPLTRGERPATISEGPGCTAELIERCLEFMGRRRQSLETSR